MLETSFLLFLHLKFLLLVCYAHVFPYTLVPVHAVLVYVAVCVFRYGGGW